MTVPYCDTYSRIMSTSTGITNWKGQSSPSGDSTPSSRLSWHRHYQRKRPCERLLWRKTACLFSGHVYARLGRSITRQDEWNVWVWTAFPRLRNLGSKLCVGNKRDFSRPDDQLNPGAEFVCFTRTCILILCDAKP